MTLPVPANELANMDMVTKATALAVHAHAGQVDKAGLPYFYHPLRAADYFAATDFKARAATILHDVIEDTPVTAEDLREVFSGFGMHGHEVVGAVVAVSRVKGQSDLAYLQQIVAGGPLAVRVKIADSNDNSREERLDDIVDDDVRDRMRVKYGSLITILGAVLNGMEP